MKQYYVYIMSNNSKILYIGVTDNLTRRVYEHKNKLLEGFTKRYNLTKLVYYEVTNDINAAIRREKQLKNWHREWKINLIESVNKEWKDLAEEFFGENETKDAKEDTEIRDAEPRKMLKGLQHDSRKALSSRIHFGILLRSKENSSETILCLYNVK